MTSCSGTVFGFDSITGSVALSWGAGKDPVSIQVSWPEGFFTGRFKNQTSPPISSTWIAATTMSALRKRGSDELIAIYFLGEVP